MRTLSRERLAGTYMLTVIAAGMSALLFSLAVAPFDDLSGQYLLLLFLTALVSGRGVIEIPGTKGHISVADGFIFLTMLLFGAEAAVLTASFEALYCSLRCTKRARTALFNMAAVGLSTFATGLTVTACVGPPASIPASAPGALLAAACVMAVTQYTLNSWLVSVGVALRSGGGLLATWKTGFLWTSVTYIGGAGAAVLIAKVVASIGFYATLAVVPVAAIVYFTYVTYLRNVEVSAAQAEQARRHAEELGRHIAEQERIARRLRESEEQFRSAFDNAPVGMALLSPAGEVLKVNASLCGLLGYGPLELVGSDIASCVHGEDAGVISTSLEQLFGGVERADAEVRLLAADGGTVWAAASTSLVRDDGGEPIHLIAQVQDIRERLRIEEALRGLSMVDELTGLYNRRGFLIFAEQHLSVARRAGRRMMVFYADLDGMKQINDTHGHKEGDRALAEVARLFRETFRESDVVARLGGDEFTVLAAGASEEDAEVIISRLRRKVEAANDRAARAYRLSVSVGVAYFSPDSDIPIEELLVQADEAMYENKRTKRGRGPAAPVCDRPPLPDPNRKIVDGSSPHFSLTVMEEARRSPDVRKSAPPPAASCASGWGAFKEALGAAATAAKNMEGGGFAVLFADVQRLGEFNSSHGHTAGDALLGLIEARLSGCLRQGDVITRFAGGRFATLLNSTRSEADTARVARRFNESLLAPFSVAGREVSVSLAVGAALSAGGAETPDDLLFRAEAAMYEAKAEARGGFRASCVVPPARGEKMCATESRAPAELGLVM